MSDTRREWDLGLIAGLAVSVSPGAILGFLIIWLSAAWLTSKLGVASASPALLAGFSMAIIHFASEFFHQFGHAIAVRRTGFPMIGIRFGAFLFLPHRSIRSMNRTCRGASTFVVPWGPAMSIAIGLLACLVLWVFADYGSIGHPLAQFLFLDNLLLLGLGAFLPLGFTDGSTIYHYWRNP